MSPGRLQSVACGLDMNSDILCTFLRFASDLSLDCKDFIRAMVASSQIGLLLLADFHLDITVNTEHDAISSFLYLGRTVPILHSIRHLVIDNNHLRATSLGIHNYFKVRLSVYEACAWRFVFQLFNDLLKCMLSSCCLSMGIASSVPSIFHSCSRDITAA